MVLTGGSDNKTEIYKEGLNVSIASCPTQWEHDWPVTTLCCQQKLLHAKQEELMNGITFRTPLQVFLLLNAILFL
jgi:hypothetical protein